MEIHIMFIKVISRIIIKEKIRVWETELIHNLISQVDFFKIIKSI